MKAYVFYTSQVKEWIDILTKSALNNKDLEIVPIQGHSLSMADLSGQTSSQEYMKLMMTRWLKLPGIIEENTGSNIMFIDADIVFNSNKLDFIDNLENFLKENDLLTQYDNNDGMSLGINMGFLAIKCNERTLSFFREYVDEINSISVPKTGFPQIEFNNFIRDYDKEKVIKFMTLPKDYGYLTGNCYFYHAIGIGGHFQKMNAMRNALESFDAQCMVEENEIALVVNTISKNSDIWEAFFTNIKKYVHPDFFTSKYVFVDDDLSRIPKDYNVLRYDSSKTYKQQFCSCIKSVKEKYCIYISEDYILYDNVDVEKIDYFKGILNYNQSISFIRFMKGGVFDDNFEQYEENLFYVPEDKEYFYTNQAAIWKTRDLQRIHILGPNLHIANKDWQNSFEYQATKTCNELNIKGLFCYYNENKRGIYHYDSSVFPHISTALVKGKWNMREYPNEMAKLIKKFKINITKRGWT